MQCIGAMGVMVVLNCAYPTMFEMGFGLGFCVFQYANAILGWP